MSLQILYADQNFVVCIKPVGTESEKQMPLLLTQQLGGTFYPIHRLDVNVGGIMLFAANKIAAATLSRTVQEGQIIKEYVALVHGIPEETGDWEDLLWKDSSKNKVFPVKRMRTGVKYARLTYRRLAQTDPAPVRIRLYTGRSHQIRVQFASRKFPLVGDHKYGSYDTYKTPLLFCCALTFTFEGTDYHFEQLPTWIQKSSP